MEERSFHSVDEFDWITDEVFILDTIAAIEEYLDKQRRFAEYLEATRPTD